MYNNRKYVELNEEGILKRIEDIKKDLKLVGVQTKGLTTSLEAMEALLKIDIPKLRIEIKKRNKQQPNRRPRASTCNITRYRSPTPVVQHHSSNTPRYACQYSSNACQQNNIRIIGLASKSKITDNRNYQTNDAEYDGQSRRYFLHVAFLDVSR